MSTTAKSLSGSVRRDLLVLSNFSHLFHD